MCSSPAVWAATAFWFDFWHCLLCLFGHFEVMDYPALPYLAINQSGHPCASVCVCARVCGRIQYVCVGKCLSFWHFILNTNFSVLPACSVLLTLVSAKHEEKKNPIHQIKLIKTDSASFTTFQVHFRMSQTTCRLIIF